jgi:hypothetical protein
MLSEDNEKQVLCFIPTVDDKYFTLEELKENLAANQTDKDGKLVVLYAGKKKHSTRISKLQKKGSIIARLSYYFALNSKK